LELFDAQLAKSQFDGNNLSGACVAKAQLHFLQWQKRLGSDLSTFKNLFKLRCSIKKRVSALPWICWNLCDIYRICFQLLTRDFPCGRCVVVSSHSWKVGQLVTATAAAEMAISTQPAQGSSAAGLMGGAQTSAYTKVEQMVKTHIG